MNSTLRCMLFTLGLIAAPGTSIVLHAAAHQNPQPVGQKINSKIGTPVSATKPSSTQRMLRPRNPINKGPVVKSYPRTGTPGWRSKVHFQPRYRDGKRWNKHDFYGRYPREYHRGHHRSNYWVGDFWGPYLLSSAYQGIPVIDDTIDSPYEDCYVDIQGRVVCEVDNGWYYADVY